jgi:hypothetical protein
MESTQSDIPVGWRRSVDRFIEELEILTVQGGEDETWGAIPVLVCPWCKGGISGDMDGEYLWIHDGGQGVDLHDPFIMLVVKRIRELRPDWKLRSSCKACNEELTFLEQHSCPRPSDRTELPSSRTGDSQTEN